MSSFYDGYCYCSSVLSFVILDMKTPRAAKRPATVDPPGTRASIRRREATSEPSLAAIQDRLGQPVSITRTAARRRRAPPAASSPRHTTSAEGALPAIQECLGQIMTRLQRVEDNTLTNPFRGPLSLADHVDVPPHSPSPGSSGLSRGLAPHVTDVSGESVTLTQHARSSGLSPGLCITRHRRLGRVSHFHPTRKVVRPESGPRITRHRRLERVGHSRPARTVVRPESGPYACLHGRLRGVGRSTSRSVFQLGS